MEKKNTMLLTVIAVATLLVAVVGATFAYFSLTVDNQSTATKAQVKATNPSTVLLTDKKVSLKMDLGVAQMASDAQGKYYALDNTDYTEAGEGEKFSYNEVKPYEIAEFTVQNGESSVKYTCAYTVTVTAGTNLKAVLAETGSLVSGDLVLTIKGDGIGEEGKKELDLSTLKAENYEDVINGSITIASGETKKVTTELYLENRDTGQNKLAGKTLDATVVVTGGDCQLHQEG